MYKLLYYLLRPDIECAAAQVVTQPLVVDGGGVHAFCSLLGDHAVGDALLNCGIVHAGYSSVTLR